MAVIFLQIKIYPWWSDVRNREKKGIISWHEFPLDQRGHHSNFNLS